VCGLKYLITETARMEALKDKLPVIGIGLAAIAIAGYIVFGLDKTSEKKIKNPEPFEEQIEPE
jgi:hypothetical protein